MRKADALKYETPYRRAVHQSGERLPHPAVGAASRHGQHAIEYAILVTLVVLGMLFTMGTYVRRSLQARYRSVVDGSVQALKTGNQYEPYYGYTHSITSSNAAVTGSYAAGSSRIDVHDVSTQESDVVNGVPVPVGRTLTNLTADDLW